MAVAANFALRGLVIDEHLESSSSADSRRASRMNRPKNGFPTLISTEYTLVTLVPTLLRGNAVLAALRLDWGVDRNVTCI